MRRSALKSKSPRQNKYTKSARGQDCQIRIPSICNGDPETVVLAHLDQLQFRVGHKAQDIHGAWACSDCHNAVANLNNKTGYTLEQLTHMHLEGVIRTQIQMIEKGLIVL